MNTAPRYLPPAPEARIQCRQGLRGQLGQPRRYMRMQGTEHALLLQRTPQCTWTTATRSPDCSPQQSGTQRDRVTATPCPRSSHGCARKASPREFIPAPISPSLSPSLPLTLNTHRSAPRPQEPPWSPLSQASPKLLLKRKLCRETPSQQQTGPPRPHGPTRGLGRGGHVRSLVGQLASWVAPGSPWATSTAPRGRSRP